jgi:hypothetical protein
MASLGGYRAWFVGLVKFEQVVVVSFAAQKRRPRVASSILESTARHRAVESLSKLSRHDGRCARSRAGSVPPRGGSDNRSSPRNADTQHYVCVFELSLGSWLTAGLVPHLSRQPLKKLRPDPDALLRLLLRWRDQGIKAGGPIKRIVLAFEAGREASGWPAGCELEESRPTSSTRPASRCHANTGERRRTGSIPDY